MWIFRDAVQVARSVSNEHNRLKIDSFFLSIFMEHGSAGRRYIVVTYHLYRVPGCSHHTDLSLHSRGCYILCVPIGETPLVL